MGRLIAWEFIAQIYLIYQCGKADAIKIQLKQVEINIIAAGLVAQSTSLTQVHKLLLLNSLFYFIAISDTSLTGILAMIPF